MATEHSCSGLQKTEEIWSTDYTGTREELIAAGVLLDGQFPGDPGNPKSKTRLYRGTVVLTRRGITKDHGRTDVQRMGRRYRAVVYLPNEVGKQRLRVIHARVAAIRHLPTGSVDESELWTLSSKDCAAAAAAAARADSALQAFLALQRVAASSNPAERGE